MRLLKSLSFLIISWAVISGCRKPVNSNTAPVAIAGLDLQVWWPVTSTQLNGSYRDVDHNVKEVSWAKISGPNSYHLENKNALKTNISGLEIGVYLFELTVTDTMNLYDKDTMTVTVERDPGLYNNTAPKVSASEMILLLELPDNEMVLTAAAEDLENNITTYKWTKISGPDSFIFQNENLLTTRVTGLEKGAYVFELTVTDLGGLFDTASVQVIVGEVPVNPTEVIIKNPSWDSWENDYFFGFNIYDYVPAGVFFLKPYIQGESANEWIPAVLYGSTADSTGNFLPKYSLQGNGECWLWYQGSPTWKSPDIKIAY